MNILKLRHCHPIYLRVDVDDAGRPLPRDIHCTASGDIRIALTGSFRRWRFVSFRNTKTLFTLLTFEIFGTARIVYYIRGAGYMQLSGVRPSVCLSVPSDRRTLQLRVCCCGPGGQEISIDCCTAGGQQQRRRSTARSSKCGQCHVVSQGTRPNTDLFKTILTIVLHVCELVQQVTYSIDSLPLPFLDQIRDIGVYHDCRLKYDKHICLIVHMPTNVLY